MSKTKPFPQFTSDAEAERFVAEADLTDYDWSDMKPVRFEFAAKDARSDKPRSCLACRCTRRPLGSDIGQGRARADAVSGTSTASTSSAIRCSMTMSLRSSTYP